MFQGPPHWKAQSALRAAVISKPPALQLGRQTARWVKNDTQTGMPSGYDGAICVQRFDDSLNSAIHITYRSLLRSSSMHEPRDPSLKVVSQVSFFVKLLVFITKKLVINRGCKEV